MSDLERPGRYLTWPESRAPGAGRRGGHGGESAPARPRAAVRRALIAAGVVSVMLAALIMNLAA